MSRNVLIAIVVIVVVIIFGMVLTVKRSVTACPGAMVTGAGLLTAQPPGAWSVNRACGIA